MSEEKLMFILDAIRKLMVSKLEDRRCLSDLIREDGYTRSNAMRVIHKNITDVKTLMQTEVIILEELGKF